VQKHFVKEEKNPTFAPQNFYKDDKKNISAIKQEEEK
jgi:hypothetical protein